MNQIKQRIVGLVLFFSILCHFQTQAQVKLKNEDSFISMSYVSLPFLKFHGDDSVKNIENTLDEYRWSGLTDVVLIGGTFLAGRDGTILTKWKPKPWPDPFITTDFNGKVLTEESKRKQLCSKETILTIIRYFKQKNIRTWIAQTGLGWMEGGSLGAVLEDAQLTHKYAKELITLTKELGCIGVDFDWEFPPNEQQGKGYSALMKLVKKNGLKVSVCAIQPSSYTPSEDQPFPQKVKNNFNWHISKYMDYDNLIKNGYVDQINVMQYLGYDAKKEEMTVSVKQNKMKQWEDTYPKQFTSAKQVNMLCGIGFYSYSPSIQNAGGKSRQWLYEKYGKELLIKKNIEGHTFWQPEDVKNIIRLAKENGWSGIATWLVSHDVTKKVSNQYSLQHALQEEIRKN